MTKAMTKAEAQSIVDNPTTSPANKVKAQKVIEKLSRPKTKSPAAPAAPAPVSGVVPDFTALFERYEQRLKEATKPEPEVEPEKPRVNALTESQQFAQDQRRRPEPIEEPKKPQARGYLTVEEVRSRLDRDQAIARREWNAAMGLHTSQPEWPGV